MNRLLIASAALGLTLALSASPAHARTALQKHVDFFDRDLDGDIEWSETFEGCRALGISSVTSSAFATAINAALGTSTGGSLFTVKTATIHQGIHGSDTGIYDKKGNYVPEAFQALFTNYDRNRDDVLDEDEFDALAQHCRHHQLRPILVVAHNRQLRLGAERRQRPRFSRASTELAGAVRLAVYERRCRGRASIAKATAGGRPIRRWRRMEIGGHARVQLPSL